MRLSDSLSSSEMVTKTTKRRICLSDSLTFRDRCVLANLFFSREFSVSIEGQR